MIARCRAALNRNEIEACRIARGSQGVAARDYITPVRGPRDVDGDERGLNGCADWKIAYRLIGPTQLGNDMNASAVPDPTEEGNAASVGRPARRVTFGRIGGKTPDGAGADECDVDVGVVELLARPGEGDLFAVRSECRPCLFAGQPCERHDSGRQLLAGGVRRSSQVAATTRARGSGRLPSNLQSKHVIGVQAARPREQPLTGILGPRIFRRTVQGAMKR